MEEDELLDDAPCSTENLPVGGTYCLTLMPDEAINAKRDRVSEYSE
jgi:hypothetical protein